MCGYKLTGDSHLLHSASSRRSVVYIELTTEKNKMWRSLVLLGCLGLVQALPHTVIDDACKDVTCSRGQECRATVAVCVAPPCSKLKEGQCFPRVFGRCPRLPLLCTPSPSSQCSNNQQCGQSQLCCRDQCGVGRCMLAEGVINPPNPPNPPKPTNPCGKTCPEGEVCVVDRSRCFPGMPCRLPTIGSCKPAVVKPLNPCLGMTCPEGEVCVVDRPRCFPGIPCRLPTTGSCKPAVVKPLNPCIGMKCPVGELCVVDRPLCLPGRPCQQPAGKCRRVGFNPFIPCAEIVCPLGEKCVVDRPVCIPRQPCRLPTRGSCKPVKELPSK